MNPQAHASISMLAPGNLVLDCGGWFKPMPLATHVVDLMPYETRGCELHLDQLPGERFTRDTWHQQDFLSPGLRLPFPDGMFAFSHCSHTIEDLEDPLPLLGELERVSRAGCLIAPSRLSEQSAGSRDRMTSRQGHPHHHWICETEDGTAVLSSKRDALGGAWWDTAVPLRSLERMGRRDPRSLEWVYLWAGELRWRILRGPEARARAEAYAAQVGSTGPSLAADSLVRMLRRVRYLRQPSDARGLESWWRDMLSLSQPYSRIPLH